MKKQLVIIASISTVIIAALVYIIFMPAPKQNNQAAEPPAQSNAQPNQPAAPAREGQYEEYSETAVNAANGTRILFFHAAWCPQCRALEASIKAGKIPENVTIFKVDYDNSHTLRQKYNVTLQTTLVKIDDQGNEIKKFVAYEDPTLEAVKQNLLQ